LSYGIWRLKQGRAEETVKENIRKLRRLANHVNLENTDEVKEYITRGQWKNSYKELLENAYSTWCEFTGIVYKKTIYPREENLPFTPTEKEIDDLISGVNRKTSAFLRLLKETGVESGEGFKLRVKDLWIEQRIVNIRGTKRHKGRQLRISSQLVAMLLPFTKGKRMEQKIFSLNRKHFTKTYERQRKRVTEKLQNPKLLEISFRTFRHWKATMEYHKTKDILHVKRLLGHHNIKNTLIYTHLINFEGDEYVCKVAKNIDEAGELVEVGFEFVTQFEGKMLFRKRK
jgi:integrase